MSIGRRSRAPEPAAWRPWTRSGFSSRAEPALADSSRAIIIGFAAPRVWARRTDTPSTEKRHGTRLSSHGQAPDGREQRFPRQQQNEAPLSAEPALPPVLGRRREPLGAHSHQQLRPAPDRQGGHRAGRRRPARPRRNLRGAGHGQRWTREDQARIERGYRSLLHDRQEQEDDAREDRNDEVRSEGTQARDLQRDEIEIGRPAEFSGVAAQPLEGQPNAKGVARDPFLFVQGSLRDLYA